MHSLELLHPALPELIDALLRRNRWSWQALERGNLKLGDQVLDIDRLQWWLVNADPVLCKRLEEVGCATVMPLGSWIGSNQGLRTKAALEIIVEQSTVPVVVDAGIGAPSQAAEAMELGADAVLVNTAIGTAGDPVAMGAAFRIAVEAGRRGFLAGLPAVAASADASSPLTGFLSP